MATNTINGAKPIGQAPSGVLDGDQAIITWVLTSADPNGDPVTYYDYADRTVQVKGTFGGATVELQGSLDNGVTWSPLTDPQGNAISKSAAALEAVSEAVPLVRPALTNVGVGASITVMLYVRKQS